MFWDKLRRKKKKRFAVYLTKRGKALPVGIFEASGPEELYTKIIEHIQRIEDVESYSKIKIIDMETQQVVRMENPFAETGEEGEGGSAAGSRKRSTVSLDVNAVIDLMSSVHGKILEAAIDGAIDAFKKTNDLMLTVITKRIESALSALSSLQPQQQPRSSTEDELLKMLLTLIGLRALPQLQQTQQQLQQQHAEGEQR